MASANIFKGFFFTTSANTSWTQDTLYFVRTDNEGQNGYLQFNGKKYGIPSGDITRLEQMILDLSGATSGLSASTVSEIKRLEDYIGTIPAGASETDVVSYLTRLISQASGATNTKIEQLSAVTSAFSASTFTELTNVNNRVTNLSSSTEAFSASTVQEINRIDTKISGFSASTVTALNDLRTAMTVTVTTSSGTTSAATSADTYLEYTIKQGNQQVGIIKVPADIFVDTGAVIVTNADGKIIQRDGSTVTPPEDPKHPLNANSTYVEIKFNNDAENVIYINVTDLVDVYTVSGGSENYLGIQGYKVGTKIINIEDATSGSTGLLDAYDVKTYIEEQASSKVEELSAATVQEVQRLDNRIGNLSSQTVFDIVVNGVSGITTDNVASVTVKANQIEIGEALTYSGQTIAAASSSITKTFEAVIAEIVKNEIVTAQGLNILNDGLNAVSAVTVTAVQSVNTKTGTAVTIDSTDVKLGTDLTGNNIINANTASTSSTKSVLQGIYDTLGTVGNAISGTTSSDKTINVTHNADQTLNLTLNRESASNDTISAGHIEIEKNASGQTYGLMYYFGDDADTLASYN